MEQNNTKLTFENVLQRINKYISLKDSDRQQYTNDFKNICDALLNQMKAEDKVFEAFLKGKVLAGSYADGLKVSLPNEFDVIVRIKLRSNHLVIVERDSQRPGYIKINLTEVLNSMKNQKSDEFIYKKLQSLVNDKNYLIQNELQSWIESIVMRVLKKNNYKLSYNYETYNVSYTKCGPAHTLNVNHNNREFSIDFVPGIVFDKLKWVAKRQIPIGYNQLTDWMAIPKPVKSNNNKNNISFQTSYVDIERYYIVNKNNLKNTLKILKKIRDRNNIQNLKSYFIKTVFLWENLDKTPEFWNDSAAKILIYMLEKIIEYVERKEMPFFWHPKENMFANLNDNQLNTMHGQLNGVYKKIMKFKDTNPESLYYLFLNQTEINDMNQKRIEPVKNKSLNSSILKEDQKSQNQPEQPKPEPSISSNSSTPVVHNNNSKNTGCTLS